MVVLFVIPIKIMCEDCYMWLCCSLIPSTDHAVRTATCHYMIFIGIREQHNHT